MHAPQTPSTTERLYFHNASLESIDAGMTFVGPSYPCSGAYVHTLITTPFTCTCREPHGHIIIFSHDEACVLRAAIESRAMLGSVLAQLVQRAHVTRAEMKNILTQSATRQLAAGLTPTEKRILADPQAFAAFCDVGCFYRF